MGHFGEIRLADPVFSAVVLPTYSFIPFPVITEITVHFALTCHGSRQRDGRCDV